MNDPDIRQPSTTEDAPATPGWVESELDEILGGVAGPEGMARLRGAYLDCLAGIGGPADIDGAHDRCRARFLQGLEAAGLDAPAREGLDHRLAALEAEISART